MARLIEAGARDLFPSRDANGDACDREGLFTIIVAPGIFESYCRSSQWRNLVMNRSGRWRLPG